MLASELSIWIGIASPLVVAAVTWGGMRAELRHLTDRVKQLEATFSDAVRAVLKKD